MKPYFDFKQLCILAQVIMKDENLRVDNISMEAIYRTSINRSYYAAYNHVHEWLELKYGLKTRIYDKNTGKMKNRHGLSSHVLAYKDLEDISKLVPVEQKKLFKKLSSSLSTMFKKRKIADYNSESIINFKDAKESIENSEFIINNLKW